MNAGIRRSALLACAVLIAGCSTPSTRISSQQAQYDAYPPEVKSKIAAGEVDVGFTPDQVLIALGKPSRKFTRTTVNGASEVWAYTKSAGPSFSFGVGTGIGLGGSGFGSASVGTSTGSGDDPQDKLRLVFEGGKVTSIEKALK